jgi:hypothetical protein
MLAAHATPLANSTAEAIEASSRIVFLIEPQAAFLLISGTDEDR